MHHKTLAVATVAAMSVLGGSAYASAPSYMTDLVPVVGSFSELSLGTVVLSTNANISGALGYGVGTITGAAVGFPAFSFSLSPIAFSGFSLTDVTAGLSSLTASTFSASGSLPSFSFDNVAAGTYRISVSGFTAGIGAAFGQYNVTAVPEPETAAMLLAGLGMMGTIARRRKALNASA